MKKLALERAVENMFQNAQLFHYHLKVIKTDGYAHHNEEGNAEIQYVAVPIFLNGHSIYAFAGAA
ncbi:IclR family transcriptional regulator domain-containing protein [Solibacillus silvestris]|uniref:IclR family transcriptional regulator domain-containing protein n=1 Tax=Solibacillus silvestris TaxID=76853 RepID=UPI003F7DAAF7